VCFTKRAPQLRSIFDELRNIWSIADWVRVKFRIKVMSRVSFRVRVRLAELAKCATHLVKRAVHLVQRTLTKCTFQL